MASAGVTFSVVLTESGKGVFRLFLWSCDILNMLSVFTFGSAEKGQLGNGTTGERITTGNKTAFDIEPSPSTFPFSFIHTNVNFFFRAVYVKELDGKHIVQIASGPQHSLAVDDTGYASFSSFVNSLGPDDVCKVWCTCGATMDTADLDWEIKSTR
jgi:alpha-tubulin suppressor-like RCC1 family protein